MLDIPNSLHIWDLMYDKTILHSGTIQISFVMDFQGCLERMGQVNEYGY